MNRKKEKERSETLNWDINKRLTKKEQEELFGEGHHDSEFEGF